MDGDLRELNILNHYIGMPAITAPAMETAIVPDRHRRARGLCLRRRSQPGCAARRLPQPSRAVGILADLQWRLYDFGHALNPTAPIG
jgi:hypothetical protein